MNIPSIKSEKFQGLLLISCILLSIIFANSFLHESYLHLLHYNFDLNKLYIPLNKPIEWWINDGLMTIFFLLVGLEIKSELINGELASIKKASLPIAGAIGGMLVPALIYIAINLGKPTISGWAIPTATDIAFAVSIAAMVGKLVPRGLKIFLTALAIVDDLGAIIIIAFFYSDELHWLYLFYAALVIAFLMLLNYRKVYHLWMYMVPGILLWWLVFQSGIHPTIAGVLLALTVPVKAKNDLTLERLMHKLHYPVNLIIVPVFALANTAIVLSINSFNHLTTTLSIGIIFGLCFGKPIGIFLLSRIAVATGMASLPFGVRWKHIASAGMLAGIGFTMSIFIALLSFESIELHDTAKTAILLASVLSGVAGFLGLKYWAAKKVIT